MSNKNKKSNNDWLKQALLDLLIGVILILIEKLLNGYILYKEYSTSSHLRK